MLNEHAAGQGSGHLLVIEYYVLQHLLAIILCLKSLEPPERGKSIEFPQKHAILADCTIITWIFDSPTWKVFVDPKTCLEMCFGPFSWCRKFNICPSRRQILRSSTETKFPTIWMYLPLMSSLGLSYRLSDKEFWHISIEIQGFYPLPHNEEFWGNL